MSTQSSSSKSGKNQANTGPSKTNRSRPDMNKVETARKAPLPANFDKMNRNELQKLAAERDLKVGGRVDDLRARIRNPQEGDHKARRQSKSRSPKRVYPQTKNTGKSLEELKALLSAAKLRVGGNKTTLLERLDRHESGKLTDEDRRTSKSAVTRARTPKGKGRKSAKGKTRGKVAKNKSGTKGSKSSTKSKSKSKSKGQSKRPRAPLTFSARAVDSTPTKSTRPVNQPEPKTVVKATSEPPRSTARPVTTSGTQRSAPSSPRMRPSSVPASSPNLGTTTVNRGTSPSRRVPSPRGQSPTRRVPETAGQSRTRV